VAFSPDGALVIVGYDGGSARIWRLDNPTPNVLAGRGDPVTRVALSSDGKLVLTVSGISARVRSLEGNDQKIFRGLSAAKTAVLTSLGGARAAAAGNMNAIKIADAAISPGGEQVVVGASDGSAVVWNADRAPLALLDRGSPITSVSFSDDGKFVLTTNRDGRAVVWEAESGRQLSVFREGAGLSNAVLSPDDRALITSSDAGVRVQPCQACLPIAELLRLGHWTKDELKRPGA
jgi:WD40 repeat protein